MIWVFLPAFNEQESLKALLPKIKSLFEARNTDYQVVVVNDGSDDETGKILEEYSGNIPLHIITHPINRGLGETERDGFEYISGMASREDIIVRFDCDDTHEPEYIFNLVDKLNGGFDVVNTSRFQPGGGQTGVDAYRAFISRSANYFMKFLFGIDGVYDYSCGFRAYRAHIIQDAIAIFGNYFIQLRGLGFTCTLEMIVKLHIMGCRFAEVPFVLKYDQKKSQSKMVSSITTLGYFTMAFLYHWPFGGWKKQYSGLSRLYPTDPQAANEKYSLSAIRRRKMSRISF